MESIKTDSGLAPVLLFVYNRPWHTTQTLNALAGNLLAKESVLYVFCDGPKKDSTKEEREKIREVRNVVHSNNWCKRNLVFESDYNRGLAESVIYGISCIFKESKKVIVIEDDIVTSPFFLSFMNKSLNYYENNKSVFSISGYNMTPDKLLIPKDYPFDVFISLRNFTWGWGTWEDRWEKINWDITELCRYLTNTNIKQAFQRGGDDLISLLVKQMNGEIDSWAIRFTFAHFVQHAVSIVPCQSYCNNIGLDGSGTHCMVDKSSIENDLAEAKVDPKLLDVLYEDKRIINAIYSAFCTKRRSLVKKIINRLSRIVTGKNQYIIKRKIYC